MTTDFTQLAESIGLTAPQFRHLLDTQFKDHSVFSPSGSPMWTLCSGSLLPNLVAPDSSDIEAAEGTVAHSVGEKWLREGVRPSDLIGTVVVENGFEIEITDSMLDYVQEYVDRCSCLPGDHFVETRVDHSDLTPIPNQTGTADHAACEVSTLIITDLKYGKGIRVFAENNIQLALYAWGFFQKYDWIYDFQNITMRIVQPRLNNYDEWTITRDELITLTKYIKERAYRAWGCHAPRLPGEKQCQWCRIKADCAAHAAFVIRLTDGVFENPEVDEDNLGDLHWSLKQKKFKITPVGIGSLSTAEKAKLLPFRKMVEAWLSDLAADLEERAIAGEHVPGYKVVTGRSDRQFVTDSKVVDHLSWIGVDEDKLYTRKLIGIGQAEEELLALGLKRKTLPSILAPIVIKPAGKPTMVLESDKRDAIVNVFENLDEEEL